MVSDHALTKVDTLSDEDVFTLSLDPSNAAVAETKRAITFSQMSKSGRLAGDIRNFGAKIDASTDDTAACQDAIDSGLTVSFPPGRLSVEGTLTVASNGGFLGGKHLIMTAGSRLERFSDNTDPIMQVYGVQNRIEGNGAQISSRTHASTNGMFLLGPSPDATDATGADQIPTQNNWIDNLKILGQTTALGSDGSRGLYIHSAGRRRDDWLGISTFFNKLTNILIQQCDIPVEFSSDANATKLSGTILSYGRVAIMFNASYSNQCRDMFIEVPIVISSTRRYVIHYGEQNDPLSSETGTSSSYPIHGSLNDRVEGYAETLNSPGTGQLVSIFFIVDPPSSGTNYGQNRQGLMGSQPAGQGLDGFTTEASIHDTVIDNDTVFANHHRPMLLPGGLTLKRLNDDSGGIRFSGSNAWIEGHKAQMVEGTHHDAFEVDNVGTTEATLTIVITVAGNEDTNSIPINGEVAFACSIENGVVKVPRRYNNSIDTNNKTVPITVVCTSSAGTKADTAKFTISFNTESVAGTGSSFLSWGAHLVHSNLEGTNLFWDADVKFLTTSSGTRRGNDVVSSDTRKVKTADEEAINRIGLQNDSELAGLLLVTGASYRFRALILASSASTAPDIKWRFSFSETPQLENGCSIALQGGSFTTATQPMTTTLIFSLASANDTRLKLEGSFKANATAGGTLAFQWAQNVSDSTASVVEEGSWLEIEKLG